MSRKEKLEEMVSHMRVDLQLTDDQQNRLRNIAEDYMRSRRDIRQKHGTNKEARKAEIKPLNQQLRQTIGGLLNADQRDKFKGNFKNYRAILKG
jgi:hypothetical protein